MCHLRPELSTTRLTKCISCVPRALLHVCHTQTRSYSPKGPRSEPAAQHGTPHTHTHTHTQKHRDTTQHLRLRCFQQPNIPEMRDISKIFFQFLVVTLMCKLTSCSNYSAFFDKKKILLVSTCIKPHFQKSTTNRGYITTNFL